MLAPISEANERAVYLSMTEGCRAALQVLIPAAAKSESMM